jgi:hypothetical protein
VLEYAAWLGVSLPSESHLLPLVRAGLTSSLPPGWRPCKTLDSGEVYYFHFGTGETTWDHPCDAVTKGKLEAARRAGAEAEAAAAAAAAAAAPALPASSAVPALPPPPSPPRPTAAAAVSFETSSSSASSPSKAASSPPRSRSRSRSASKFSARLMSAVSVSQAAAADAASPGGVFGLDGEAAVPPEAVVRPHAGAAGGRRAGTGAGAAPTSAPASNPQSSSSDTRERLGRELAAVREKHARDLAAARAGHTQELERLRASQQRAMEEARARGQADLRTARDRHVRERAAADADHASELKRAADGQASELSSVRRAHEEAVAALRKRQGAELREAEREGRAEAERARAAALEEAGVARGQLDAEIDGERRAHAQALAALRDAHVREVEDATRAQREVLRGVWEEERNGVAGAKAALEGELAAVRAAAEAEHAALDELGRRRETGVREAEAARAAGEEAVAAARAEGERRVAAERLEGEREAAQVRAECADKVARLRADLHAELSTLLMEHSASMMAARAQLGSGAPSLVSGAAASAASVAISSAPHVRTKALEGEVERLRGELEARREEERLRARDVEAERSMVADRERQLRAQVHAGAAKKEQAERRGVAAERALEAAGFEIRVLRERVGELEREAGTSAGAPSAALQQRLSLAETRLAKAEADVGVLRSLVEAAEERAEEAERTLYSREEGEGEQPAARRTGGGSVKAAAVQAVAAPAPLSPPRPGPAAASTKAPAAILSPVRPRTSPPRTAAGEDAIWAALAASHEDGPRSAPTLPPTAPRHSVAPPLPPPSSSSSSSSSPHIPALRSFVSLAERERSRLAAITSHLTALRERATRARVAVLEDREQWKTDAQAVLDGLSGASSSSSSSSTASRARGPLATPPPVLRDRRRLLAEVKQLIDDRAADINAELVRVGRTEAWLDGRRALVRALDEASAAGMAVALEPVAADEKDEGERASAHLLEAWRTRAAWAEPSGALRALVGGSGAAARDAEVRRLLDECGQAVDRLAVDLRGYDEAAAAGGQGASPTLVSLPPALTEVYAAGRGGGEEEVTGTAARTAGRPTTARAGGAGAAKDHAEWLAAFRRKMEGLGAAGGV